MSDLSTIQEWNATLDLLAQLWPDWNPTTADSRLWHKKCRGLNQPRLRAALEDHRCQKPRPGVSQKYPNIGEVLALFRGSAGHGSPRRRQPLFTDEQVDGVRRDRQEMLDELFALDRDELRAAIEAGLLRYLIFKTGAVTGGAELQRRTADAMASVPINPQRWPDDFLGFVWAAHQAGPNLETPIAGLLT